MRLQRTIAFSDHMVKRILYGQKTQMRKIIAPKLYNAKWNPDDFKFDQIIILENSKMVILHESDQRYRDGDYGKCSISCPYGKPGDIIWVKEACKIEHAGGNWIGVIYKSDNHYEEFLEPPDGWANGLPKLFEDLPHDIPAVQMPKWASRLKLEIADIRVERINSISACDARAEGAKITCPCGGTSCDQCLKDFPKFWDLTHRKGSWSQNPWVWVIEFKLLDPIKENEEEEEEINV